VSHVAVNNSLSGGEEGPICEREEEISEVKVEIEEQKKEGHSTFQKGKAMQGTKWGV